MQPAALLAYWYSVRAQGQGQSLIAQPGTVICQQIAAVLTIDHPILATSSPLNNQESGLHHGLHTLHGAYPSAIALERKIGVLLLERY